MEEAPREVSTVLRALDRGEKAAFRKLVPLVYDDLRRLAHGRLGRLRPGETLNTTALVHEAYLKLAGRHRLSARDRGHFLAIAARAMRQVVVDHARTRTRHKRGGGAPPVPLDEAKAAVAAQAEEVLAVHQALERLGAVAPRLERVVDCRYFAGLSEAETAEALGVSTRTVERDWLKAKAWLREELAR